MWKLMLVDDEENIRKGLMHQFDWNSLGFEVIDEASDGEMALEKISTKKPDVLLTDIRMPGMDGLDLLEKIKKKGLTMFVVLLSGYSDFKYAQKAIEYGVFSYILKPVKQAEVRDVFLRLNNALNSQKKILNTSILHDTNLRYLIPNYLSRLLNGYYKSEDDTHDIYNKLCIPVMKYCSVMIMVPKLTEKSGDFITIFENAIAEFNKTKYSDNESVYCYGIYSYKNDEIIFVSFHRNNFNGKENSNKILDIKKQIEHNIEMKATFKISFICSVSNTYPTNCCKMAYEEASKLQSGYFFSNFIKKDIIINSDYLLKNSRNHEDKGRREEINLINIVNKLCKNIIERRLDDSVGLINHYFGLLESFDNKSKEDIMILVNEMLLMLSMKLKEKNININSLIQDKTEISRQSMMKINNFYELRSYIRKMIILIIEELNNLKSNTNEMVVKAIKKYIESNINKQLSLEDIAGIVFLNPSYISKIFKENSGVNYSEYVTNLRIEKAQELLGQRGYKIEHISRDVGFDSQKYFSRVFRLKTGFSPTQYRKMSKI